MHGAPLTLACLRGYLETQEKQEEWQAYIADTAWLVLKALHPKTTMPCYTTLNDKSSRTDTRSGQEIVKDIISSRRRKRRKEENSQ